MYYFPKNKESGFTLIELLIVMTISLIILAAFSGVFLMQRRVYDVQEQIVEMVQNARAAMDMMSREVRMAGYNPTGAGFYGITRANHRGVYVLLIQADLNGNGTTTEGDGVDPNEYVRYGMYPDRPNQISRTTGTAGSRQPFAENIEAFTVDYLDGAGEILPEPVVSANIRQIEITIIARTAKPDPNYGGYRTHTLTSVITPRNLGL